MSEVRLKRNYEQWISFISNRVEFDAVKTDESAQDAISSIDEMTALQAENREKVIAMGRASKSGNSM
ncbi:MAG: hypothetical protein ACOYEL_06150 [Saccharofermentanales bacterium]